MTSDRSIHSKHAPPTTLDWIGGVDGHLVLIDQTLLPVELRRDRVPRRGSRVGGDSRAARARAPAIGIAAAYGVCLGLQAC